MVLDSVACAPHTMTGKTRGQFFLFFTFFVNFVERPQFGKKGRSGGKKCHASVVPRPNA